MFLTINWALKKHRVLYVLSIKHWTLQHILMFEMEFNFFISFIAYMYVHVLICLNLNFNYNILEFSFHIIPYTHINYFLRVYFYFMANFYTRSCANTNSMNCRGAVCEVLRRLSKICLNIHQTFIECVSNQYTHFNLLICQM